MVCKVPTLYIRSIYLLIWRQQLEERGQLRSSLLTGAAGPPLLHGTQAARTDRQTRPGTHPPPPRRDRQEGASVTPALAEPDNTGGGTVPLLPSWDRRAPTVTDCSHSLARIC